jgi:hypothetical protein
MLYISTDTQTLCAVFSRFTTKTVRVTMIREKSYSRDTRASFGFSNRDKKNRPLYVRGFFKKTLCSTWMSVWQNLSTTTACATATQRSVPT